MYYQNIPELELGFGCMGAKRNDLGDFDTEQEIVEDAIETTRPCSRYHDESMRESQINSSSEGRSLLCSRAPPVLQASS